MLKALLTEPRPEISDVIVDYDPRAPRPQAGPEEYGDAEDGGSREHLGFTVRCPVPELADEVLDPEAVDEALLASHLELQRLNEEFANGLRVRTLLQPMVEVLRLAEPGRPIRVVDVGCGLGYLVRWLAARGQLGPDVELIGVDYNHRLVRAASALVVTHQPAPVAAGYRRAGLMCCEQRSVVSPYLKLLNTFVHAG